MKELNRQAADIALGCKIDTMTDVTGFGLLGHALEVAKASGIAIQIDHKRLPVLPGALEYSTRGFCSSGLQSNLEFGSPYVQIDDTVPAEFRNLLFDPQTSGGLLVFCPKDRAASLRNALEGASLCSAEIGFTEPASDAPAIRVR
jgi:selenide,water dikinase